MKNLRTITVGKLVELLEQEDQEALVVFACNYGDYHRTQQALAVRGEIEECTLTKSAYSESGFAVVEEREDEDEDGETYVVIR